MTCSFISDLGVHKLQLKLFYSVCFVVCFVWWMRGEYDYVDDEFISRVLVPADALKIQTGDPGCRTTTAENCERIEQVTTDARANGMKNSH